MAQYLPQTRDALSAVCEAYAHGDQSTLHAGTAACLRTSAFFQCRDVEEVARHFSGLMSRVRESPIRESLDGNSRNFPNPENLRAGTTKVSDNNGILNFLYQYKYTCIPSQGTKSWCKCVLSA